MTENSPKTERDPEAIRIGALIRAHRSELPKRQDGRLWTQARFGILVGVEGPTVYAWEAGRALPSHAQLCALVQKAGMDPVSLLGEQSAVELVTSGVAS